MKGGKQRQNPRGPGAQRERLVLQLAAKRENGMCMRPHWHCIAVANKCITACEKCARCYLQVLACGCSLHHQLVGQAVLGAECSAEWSETHDLDRTEYRPTSSPFSAELKSTKCSHQTQAITLITPRHPTRFDAPTCITGRPAAIFVLTRIFDRENGNQPESSKSHA